MSARRIPGVIVIAGGGTAGHVLPGLAVARALVARGAEPGSIQWIGSARGQEAELVPPAGFPLTLLPGRGIQRRLSIENVASAWGLVRAIGSTVWSFRRDRPCVVMTLGGYASLAPIVAAILWRVPIVVTEQNARAGAANQIAGRFAVACAVPFDSTDLPRATVTGNPVRPEILAAAADPEVRAAARRRFGVADGQRLIAVFAGSLGSARINHAVSSLAVDWADRDDLVIRHVVGRRDFASATRPAEGSVLDWVVIEYEEHMDQLLAAADLAVCRSGGSTVAELAAMSLPAVLVPLPIATRDHQTANAAALVDVGGAVMVADGELDAGRLERELEQLLVDGVLGAMRVAVGSIAHPDAADRVAALVESAVRA